MKRRSLEKRIACMVLSGALALTNASGVFAAEQKQAVVEAVDQTEDQSEEQSNEASQIDHIELEKGAIVKNHSTYKRLTCGSSMNFGAKVYKKDGSLATGSEADVTVDLHKKGGASAQAVCKLIYTETQAVEEGEIPWSYSPRISIYAPYGYEEQLELVVSSKKDPSVKMTYTFETVQDDRDGTTPVKFQTGTTAGKVTVGTAKQKWNVKKQKYTVTLPKVKTTKKADQFVGWSNEGTDHIYKAGETVEISGSGIEIFEAVWKQKTGTKFTVEYSEGEHYNLYYKVTGKDTVELTKYEGLCKCIHGLELPNTVEFHNTKYRITSIADKAFKGANLKELWIGKHVKKIGKNVFQNDGYLKNITIGSSKITSVGKNAFADLSKNTVIDCPYKKVKAYKKLFQKAGLNKKVKINGYEVTTSY